MFGTVLKFFQYSAKFTEKHVIRSFIFVNLYGVGFGRTKYYGGVREVSLIY